MSGPIRSVISLQKSLLPPKLSKIPQFNIPDYDSQMPPEDYRDILDELDADISQQLDDIDFQISAIDKWHGKWVEFIDAIQDEEDKKAELILFDNLALGNDGFLNIVQNAQASVRNLRGLRDRIRKRHLKMDRLTAATTTTTGSTNVKVDDSEPPAHTPQLSQPKLVTFYGDITKWSEFWESFTYLVDQKSYSDQFKLSQLISHLDGRAKEEVEGYTLEGKNYQIVKDILQEIYGNSEVIKMRLQNELTKLPKAENKEIGPTIRQIEKICRQLECRSVDLNQLGYRAILESKFPFWFIRNMYSVASADKNWDVSKMREYFRKWVRDEEAAREAVISQSHARPSTQQNPNKTRRPHTSHDAIDSSMTTNYSSLQKVPKDPCVFCTEVHWNKDCRVYNTPEKRFQRAKTLRICYHCLKNHQNFKDCEKQRDCRYCPHKHHPLLCLKNSNQVHNLGETSQYKRKDAVRNSLSNSNFTPLPNSATGKPILKRSVENNSSMNTFEAGTSFGKLRINADKPFSTSCASTQCDSENSDSVDDTLTSNSNDESEVLFLTKEVTMFNPADPERSCKALILFDNCSNQSYIREEKVEKLFQKGPPDFHMKVTSFGSDRATVYASRNLELGCVLADGSTKIFPVRTIKHINQQVRECNSEKVNDLWANELEVPTAMRTPDVLIGANLIYDFIDFSTTKELPSRFRLVNSTVGKLLSGKGRLLSESVCCVSFAEKEPEITIPTDKEIFNFWNLESIGISDNPDQDDDEEVTKFFQDTVKFKEGRFEVRWPWKNPIPPLPDNYGKCFGRLKSVLKRLEGDSKLLERYEKTIKEQITAGIVEVVPESVEPASLVVHYLAHHPVITPEKATTKLRIVFDASSRAKAGSPTLNECLYRGPVLLPDLAGILLRFRNAKIVLVGDIEKAFHQILLNLFDRDVTRFLWLKDITKPLSYSNIQVLRFCRVLFGVISSPFLLAACIVSLLDMTNSKFSENIRRNNFVDNIHLFLSSSEEAIEAYYELKRIFGTASMNIRQFLSNDPSVNESFAVIDRQPIEPTKILGIKWDPVSDNIHIKLPRWVNSEAITKRKVMKLVAKIYDPLGFLCPMTFPFKKFIQSLWEQKLGWDDPLPFEKKKEWESLFEKWSESEIIISRRASSKDSGNAELHIFTDASQYSYAAVAYIVSKDTHPFLIFSKNRLRPTKGMTIPRMELMGLLIGHRISKFILSEIDEPINDIHIWCDSQIVLSWLFSRKQQSMFVENRLKEIRTSKATFHYVPSADNSADISTKGRSFQQLSKESLWWVGPEWLSKSKSEWPTWDRQFSEITDEEDRPVTTLHTQTQSISPPRGQILDESKYGTWFKALKPTSSATRMSDYFERKELAAKYSNIFNDINSQMVDIAKMAREGPPELWTLIQGQWNSTFESLFHLSSATQNFLVQGPSAFDPTKENDMKIKVINNHRVAIPQKENISQASTSSEAYPKLSGSSFTKNYGPSPTVNKIFFPSTENYSSSNASKNIDRSKLASKIVVTNSYHKNLWNKPRERFSQSYETVYKKKRINQNDPGDVPPPKQPCAFCQEIGKHWTARCKNYTTIESRRKRLLQLECCDLCGKPGSAEHQCEIKECRTCKEFTHWVALCPKNEVIRESQEVAPDGVSEDKVEIENPPVQSAVSSKKASDDFEDLSGEELNWDYDG